jgi:hypothetical protein
MSSVVDGLRGDVQAVGELGDETVAEVADRIATVLSRSVPGVVLDLLSQAGAELSSQLPDGTVEVRVSGDDVDLSYVPRAEAPVAAPPSDADGDLSARITLRLGEGLKLRVEQAAAAESLSVNSFIVRTLDRNTTQGGTRTSPGGQRLRGYAIT